MVLCDGAGRLFWARRAGLDGWQFPQGGINARETPEQAMFRELREEIGLRPEHVEILMATNDWLRYRLPKEMVRRDRHPVCIGQKQLWYLLRLVGNEDEVNLNCAPQPEFDRWRWVDYWLPVREVITFKRRVYQAALERFAVFLGADGRQTASAMRSAPAPRHRV